MPAPAAVPVRDRWAVWGAAVDHEISVCVAAKKPDCLEVAFRSHPHPPARIGAYVADTLYRDLRTAEALIHEKNAAALLDSGYGIDSADYLATGFSVPLTGSGAHDYEFAIQREFFVPNLCAEAADPKICPRADSNIWAWHLSLQQLEQWLDRPLTALFASLPPRAGGSTFAAHLGPGAKPWKPGKRGLPVLLIRFGNFPLKFYSGKIGRPDAKRVFFASF